MCFFFKQKTSYEMRISDCSSDVCSSDLAATCLSAPSFAGTLTGIVRDGSGTSGLQGAELEIQELKRRASADIDGSFRCTDVPAGRYTLRASYAGAETKTTSVNVTETGTTTVGIALSANGDEEATILDRKSTRLNSSHYCPSHMLSSA